MGLSTSATIRGHLKSRLRPKFNERNFSPYVFIFDELAVKRLNFDSRRRLSFCCGWNDIKTSDPVSIKNVVPEYR